LGAVPRRLILPSRDSAGANRGEAPGDLLLRGQAISVRPRPYREPPAHDLRTSVESSLRMAVET
jgi:hypothetical protein